jgi:hypothetical protein
MRYRSFSLKPFSGSFPYPGIEIKGIVGRHEEVFTISFALYGRHEELLIPARTDKASRRNGLWKETCFEFFLAAGNSPRYWEFNISPAGHWNVYRFSDYRQGMEEEPSFASMPFSVRETAEAFSIDLRLGLSTIVWREQTLQVAVSAVLKDKEGKVSHWALTHTGPQADFHRRDSFIIEL